MALTDEELDRYARHLVLREVGGVGQARLKAAHVLVVGAGGLGSPLILYLAAAGVGTIGIIDDDVVSLSNLQRQIAHKTADTGQPKTGSAARAALALNPHCQIELHQTRLTPANVAGLIKPYDLVADGTDNFESRFLLNDACYFGQKPLISAAVSEFSGQLATFRAFDRSGAYPCYRCFLPHAPPPGAAPPCSETGILGAVAGVMGSLQAQEVLKEILGLGLGLAGRLLLYDAKAPQMRVVGLKPDPQCPLCSASPVIKSIQQGQHQ